MRNAALLVLAFAACSGRSAAPRHVEQELRGRDWFYRVEVEVFVMSKCPYSAKVQESMVEVLERVGGYVEYEQHFVGTEESGSPSCLHGESECKGNVVQLCAAEHAPESLVELSGCMARNQAAIPDIWVACARGMGMDEEQGNEVNDCVKGQEGQELLEKSFAIAAERGVNESPTVYIGGQEHGGGLSAGDLVAAICEAIEEEARPVGCPGGSVKVTIIMDERCADCRERARKQEERFAGMFGKLEVEWVEWSEAEGLAGRTGVTLLPAFLFHPGVENAPGWEQLEPLVEEKEGFWVVKPHLCGATFDPGS